MSEFNAFSAAVQASFDHALKEGGGKLYRTSRGADLVETYLAAFSPGDERQYHNCSCCKSFLTHFGGLAYFDKDGRQHSVMWGQVAKITGLLPDYRDAAVSLARAVANAAIIGTFHSSKPILGVPEAGGFNHFAVQVPKANRYSRRDMTAGQYMALQRERRTMLASGLSIYKAHLPAALALLKSGQLNRSAAYVAQAEKLVDLCDFDNDKLWRAVATEGDGFCHFNSGVLGTLLEDLAKGKTTDEIVRKHNALVAPEVFRTPTAAPKAAQIDQAEKLFNEMDLTRSLERRQARWNELDIRYWTADRNLAKEGTFGHLRQKVPVKEPSRALPTTWSKFLSTHLPSADQVFLVLGPQQAFSFGGITQAVHEDAQPILAWDLDSSRNTLGWYRWPSATGQDFGIAGLVKVTRVAPLPGSITQGTRWPGAFLALEGAQDKHLAKASTGLYPEGLRPDMQQVSRVIAMHSRKQALAPVADPAVGLFVTPNTPFGFMLRTETAGVAAEFIIDRWE